MSNENSKYVFLRITLPSLDNTLVLENKLIFDQLSNQNPVVQI